MYDFSAARHAKNTLIAGYTLVEFIFKFYTWRQNEFWPDRKIVLKHTLLRSFVQTRPNRKCAHLSSLHRRRAQMDKYVSYNHKIYIFLHNITRFQVLQGIKNASAVQKLQPFFFLILLNGGAGNNYFKITSLTI